VVGLKQLFYIILTLVNFVLVHKKCMREIAKTTTECNVQLFVRSFWLGSKVAVCQGFTGERATWEACTDLL